RIATLPTGQTLSVLFDSSGRSLFTSGVNGSVLHRWPIRSGTGTTSGRVQLGPPKRIGLVPGSRRARGSLTRDGRALVARLALFIRENVFTNAGLILNVDRPGEKPRIIRGAIYSIAVSPDAKWVATTVENDYEGKLWDAQTGRRVKVFPGVMTAHAAFSPDN